MPYEITFTASEITELFRNNHLLTREESIVPITIHADMVRRYARGSGKYAEEVGPNWQPNQWEA